MKYLVQAILVDGDIETIPDSFKTDNYQETLDFVMKRHRISSSYIYIVLDLTTKEVLIRTTENKFAYGQKG